MADDNTDHETETKKTETPEDDASKGGKDDKAKSKTVTLTQDELNELLGKTRAESRTATEKSLKAEIAKLENERKLSLLKEDERKAAEAKMKEEATQKELNDLRRSLAVKDAEAELAKAGLDPSFAEVMIGEDAEKTKANIAALKKAVDDMVKKQVETALKTGAPGTGKGSAGASLKEEMRKAAGLPAKK